MTVLRLLALLIPAALGCALPAHATEPGHDAGAVMARVEAPQAAPAGELERLTIAQLLERLKVPGLSVAVVHDFRLHWAKGYGVADARSARLVDMATRFQAASISKPVTALAAMRLVQDKRLDLDADVNAILTSWQVPKAALHAAQPVTPRSLLSHTSGADDGFGFDGYAPEAPLPTVVQILEGKAPANHGKVAFSHAPYARSKYSGGGLVLLQLALMDLSGQPFEQFMQATVLKPLDMARSGFLPPPATDRNVALAHDKAGARKDSPWRVYPEMAAASLWTTPSDLARVMLEIQHAVRGPQGRVLHQQAAREMITPVGVGRYAMGAAVGQRGQGWYFSHGGDNWGYRAFMMGHVRKGYGFVIMTNGDNGMALMNQVAERLTNAYDWDREDS